MISVHNRADINKIYIMTQEQFIEKSKEIHGDKYDYSKVEYINNSTKVCIICPVHGEFWQLPKIHLKGCNCPKCAKKSKAEHNTLTQEEFIRRARKKHGNKYDYSKVVYVNNRTKVCIICPIHGEFWQKPANHLIGQGCPKCAGVHKSSTEEFIEKARKIHSDKYDYSKVNYINNHTKVCIICPEHGEFWQKPLAHILGFGCSKCSNNHKLTTQEFIEKSNLIYNDKYIYNKVKYINNNTPVIITCPIHGDFEQTPRQHLKGNGCPICNGSKITTEEFIRKAKKIHGDKYDYSKVEYKGNLEKVCIICSKHGEFWQRPHEHLDGCGCPKCSITTSSAEVEIINFIEKELNLSVELHDKNILNGKEIDIYIPSKKIGIEYNGLIWHSEKFGKGRNYHLNKTEECNKKGIKLIQIFEDEYLNHKDIVIEKIRHLLDKDNSKEKIYARKCFIRKINKIETEIFLNKNHIQGYSPSTVYLGCFYENNLIAVMTFKEEQKDSGLWELNRFATDITKHCIGVGGKLFKYFIIHYIPLKIKSFADRRWTINIENNLYTKLGFKLDRILPPDYRYFCKKEFGDNRIHKFNFRKQILHKKFGLSLTMTEKEMCDKISAYRIWDCGLYKYVWKS